MAATHKAVLRCKTGRTLSGARGRTVLGGGTHTQHQGQLGRQAARKDEQSMSKCRTDGAKTCTDRDGIRVTQ